MLPVELLSRFSRAPGANSPAIGRMVAEAAVMVLVTSERCVVPFYPCVSPSSTGIRRQKHYGPTHVLAVTTTKHQKEQQAEDEEEEGQEDQEEEEEEEEEDEEERETDSDDAVTLAVVWGERCGLQFWRCSHANDMMFQPLYHICTEVRLPVSQMNVKP